MPSYGFSDEQIGTVTNYFLGMHQRPFVMTNYMYTPDASLIPAGKALFEKLKCLSCHYIGTPTTDTKAPNFQLVKNRLRPEWVEHWIARPDSIMPGTPMTAFWWASGKVAAADPDILGGNAMMQIRAVHDYVQSLGTGTVPTPTPYSTINGSDRYVLPNGEYQVVRTNAMPAENTAVKTAEKKHAEVLRKSGKPAASK